MSNETTLQGIAKDIGSIKEHLAKINNRVEKVEQNARQNEKDIAVLSERCQLVTHYTDEDLEQIRKSHLRTEEKLWDWLKSNGAQLIQIVLLIIVLIQLAAHSAP